MLSVPSSKGLAGGGTLPWLAGDSFPRLLEPSPHSKRSHFPEDLQPCGIFQALPFFRPVPDFLARITSAGRTVPASGRLFHFVISGGLASVITSSEPSSHTEEGARRAVLRQCGGQARWPCSLPLAACAVRMPFFPGLERASHCGRAAQT